MAEVKPLKLASGIITELGSSDTIPVSAIPLASLGVTRVLTTTVRNCSNTASEVSVIEATIPAPSSTSDAPHPLPSSAHCGSRPTQKH